FRHRRKNARQAAPAHAGRALVTSFESYFAPQRAWGGRNGNTRRRHVAIELHVPLVAVAVVVIEIHREGAALPGGQLDARIVESGNLDDHHFALEDIVDQPDLDLDVVPGQRDAIELALRARGAVVGGEAEIAERPALRFQLAVYFGAGGAERRDENPRAHA